MPSVFSEGQIPNEKPRLNTLPRHQNLRKRGCAAGVNTSFTHSDEMERRRYTDAPAFWCCVSAEPHKCDRLLTGSRVLRVLCTDRGVYERVCSARAAKVDSLHSLLAAGRAAALLPPGQQLFASGNAFLDEIRCDWKRSNSRDRTPRSP